jgi:hypothetical protein
MEDLCWILLVAKLIGGFKLVEINESEALRDFRDRTLFSAVHKSGARQRRTAEIEASPRRQSKMFAKAFMQRADAASCKDATSDTVAFFSIKRFAS